MPEIRRMEDKGEYLKEPGNGSSLDRFERDEHGHKAVDYARIPSFGTLHHFD